jgi:hypothetical protein
MKTLLIAALAAASCLGQSIGTQQRIGNLLVHTTKTAEDYTVFVASSDCQTSDVRIVLRIVGAATQQKVATLTGCGSTPSRVTFKTNGQQVRSVHALELGIRSAHTLEP